MNDQTERTIMKFYPKQALASPLTDTSITWSYDPKYEQLKALLTELRGLDSEAHAGTRVTFDISEEVVLRENVHVYLSYLGPFAAINFGLAVEWDESQQECARAVERALARHKYTLLDDAELEEGVAWIVSRTGGNAPRVWDCLFVNETGAAVPVPSGSDSKSVIQWL
jgi:hypothetical protein